MTHELLYTAATVVSVMLVCAATVEWKRLHVRQLELQADFERWYHELPEVDDDYQFTDDEGDTATVIPNTESDIRPAADLRARA
jgi:hypothetical protein